MNPFKFGQVVSAENFCHRPELIRLLKSYIQSAQNTVLQGERRMGKTSLVYETSRRLRGYRLLVIDLMGIKCADDLCKRMARALVTMERQSGLFEKTLAALSRLRPSISFDPISGQPGVSFDTAVRLTPDSINGLADMIQSASARRKLIVLFDEFQDILNLPDAAETLAILRGKIQYHEQIPYVFAGSMRNQMMEIFTQHDSPLFKAALPIEIGAIDPGVFVPFLAGKFATGKRSLPEAVAKEILELAAHTSGDIQQLCSALWETTSHGAALTHEHLGPALVHIFAQEVKGYEATLIQITGQQQNGLRALATLGGRNPYSADFLRESGIAHGSSVKKALSRLCQLRIIYPRDEEYRFVNPFFRHWLLWRHV